MSIEIFLKIAERMPTNTSVLLRGDHGIGKSQVIHQLAARREKIDGIKRKVIDRRLAQMTEGDMLGLPSTDGKVTYWNPMEWFNDACNEPCILLLDELNRANTEIMQAAFEIVLDRRLAGKELHPDTIVAAAVNVSAAYTTNEIDPALLDRFWVIDLEVPLEDWCDWAARKNTKTERSNVDPSIVSFIRSNPMWLDPPKDSDPQAVNPSRRTWERLSNTLCAMEIIDDPEDHLFYATSMGFVGVEAAAALISFVKNYDRQITGKEIINSLHTKKVLNKLKNPTQDQLNDCIEKVGDYFEKFKGKTLSKKQQENLKKFWEIIESDELRLHFYSRMMKNGIKQLDLVRSIHQTLGTDVLGIFGMPIGGGESGDYELKIPSFMNNPDGDSE